MLPPLVPLPSKFNNRSIVLAKGCCLKNASAPSKPASSPSVKMSITEFLKGASRTSALVVSRMAATAAPSSPAPGAISTES